MIFVTVLAKTRHKVDMKLTLVVSENEVDSKDFLTIKFDRDSTMDYTKMAKRFKAMKAIKHGVEQALLRGIYR